MDSLACPPAQVSQLLPGLWAPAVQHFHRSPMAAPVGGLVQGWGGRVQQSSWLLSILASLTLAPNPCGSIGGLYILLSQPMLLKA